MGRYHCGFCGLWEVERNMSQRCTGAAAGRVETGSVSSSFHLSSAQVQFPALLSPGAETALNGAQGGEKPPQGERVGIEELGWLTVHPCCCLSSSHVGGEFPEAWVSIHFALCRDCALAVNLL
jgi:hypothetical protein